MTQSLVDELIDQAVRLEKLAAGEADNDEVLALLAPAGHERVARLLRTAADVIGVGLERG